MKLKNLASQVHMDVERLRAIEQYKELPTHYELIRILKQTNHYFDEVVFCIWQDIQDHYVPRNNTEYKTIQKVLKLENKTTDNYENLAELEKDMHIIMNDIKHSMPNNYKSLNEERNK